MHTRWLPEKQQHHKHPKLLSTSTLNSIYQKFRKKKEIKTPQTWNELSFILKSNVQVGSLVEKWIADWVYRI